ncbi:NAD(P)H-dependent oxidoreductase [Nonomuraea sp. NPDC059023]|uniref:NAD(P)H-dependent oxidoreductase n=1 Tax=unclassified Nonomuraea TaxID=2593643 RepID=UPI00368FCB51
MRRIAVIHAGWGSRDLAKRLLDAVRETDQVISSGRVISVMDLVPSMGRALVGEAWDPPLHEARRTTAAADGLIAVTPIVHGAYSGPFKSFVDLMGTATLAGKPVLIAACGGTQRHCLALEHVVRPLFVCLRCVVLPTAVYATSEEVDSTGIGERIARAAHELVDQMAAPCAGARPTAVVGGA